MIIVKVKGGLGNQMFQYALGRRLAIEHNTQLKLDLSWFKTQRLRSYLLDRLNIKAEIASDDEVGNLFRNPPKNIFSKVIKKTSRFLPFITPQIIRQKKVGFDARALKVKGDVYLDGYWQSEKYFNPIENMLRKEFRPTLPLSDSGKRIKSQIESSLSVSVHIRRGDYIKNAKTNAVHGVCSPDYYARATAYLLTKVGPYQVFVFSDEPEWAKENLQLPGNPFYVSRDTGSSDTEHLFLMSMCKHNIIANSSFSWWAAWLNSNSEKIVIAPKKWFNDPQRNQSATDLIPKEWEKL